MSITIGSTSSDSVGVIVEAYPSRIIPDRKQAVFEVVGRNGDIVDVYGARSMQSFSNYIQQYDIYMNAESVGLEQRARRVAKWLYNSSTLGYAERGYIELQDSYEPDYYREAYFVGPADVASTLARFGRCTISFSCKPQKFLLSGQTSIPLTSGTNTFTNPSNLGGGIGWYSHPRLYFVNLTGPVKLQFENGTYRLNVPTTQTWITWDTDTGEVINSSGLVNNYLEYVNTWDMPFLNTKLYITPDAGVTFDTPASTIRPRWWLL